jgi:hypothetical protein
MCGYCIEALGVEILEAALSGIAHECVAARWPLALEMLAQEGDPEMAVQLGRADSMDWPSPLTLRCRRIDAAFAVGAPFAQHVDPFGHPALNGWREGDPDMAAIALERFAAWWPRQNPDADKADPYGWSPAKDAKDRELDDLLPELWAAQAIAFRQPLSPRATTAARSLVLMKSPYVPAPEGRDLWLQRRAMLAWHAQAGPEAVRIAQAAGVRTELFRYILIRSRPGTAFL